MAKAEPGWGTLAVYGVPALGVAAPSFFVQFYFLNFATDTLLLAPATVGALLGASRLWDAVSDPLAGYGSDRTRSRWGRRRPWMAAAAPATALAFLALWSPPAAMDSELALILWSAAALFLLNTAVTAWGVPHEALGVELSDDPHARIRIFGTRFVVAVLGAALSFGGIQLVGNAADPRESAHRLAVAVAIAVFLLLLVPVFALRERPEFQLRRLSSPWRATRDLIANPNAARLLVLWFAAQLGMSAQGVIAPYMATYVIERPDLMGVLPALFIGPLVLSVPVWIRLAQRLGRKRAWVRSMQGAAASYLLLFGLPADDIVVIGALLAMAGFFTGCLGCVGPSFFASLVDDEARRSGERREGVVFSAKEFVEKASGAAVAMVVGGVLQWVDFVPNVEQSQEVRLAIRACLGLLPGAALLLAALLLGRLEIDDAAPLASR